MNKDDQIIIVGAGGFGREVLFWTLDTFRLNTKDSGRIVGFIDDNLEALKNSKTEFKIISKISDHQPKPNQLHILAVGDPKTKISLYQDLKNRGARFFNLIHPSAVVAPDAILGEGVVVAPGVYVSTETKIGNVVTLNTRCAIGHGVVVEEGATVSSFVDTLADSKIGRGTYLGSHSVVLQGVQTGPFSKVGAGSVAIRNVPESKTVFGVPGKLI